MTSSAVIFASALDAAKVAAARIPDAVSSVRALADTDLLGTQRELAALRRIVDARASLVAGEIAFRSRRELGYAGLAQKEGFGTAEKLVQATTGSASRRAAARRVSRASRPRLSRKLRRHCWSSRPVVMARPASTPMRCTEPPGGCVTNSTRPASPPANRCSTRRGRSDE
jgi:hypothetical protein